MAEREFYRLHADRGALIDGTSTSLLAVEWPTLTKRIRGVRDAEQLKDEIYGGQCFATMAIKTLLHLIMFELVAADYRAIAPDLPTELTTLIKSTEIPQDTVGASGKRIRAVIKFLADRTKWFEPTSVELSDAQYEDELLLRQLQDAESQLLDDHIGPSGETLARAALYLEASRSADVPLLLGPTKSNILNTFSRYLSPRVRRMVRPEVLERVSGIFQEQVSRRVSDSLMTRSTLPLPPLDNYLFYIAARDQSSLFEAALAIREDPNAAAFRHWIWDLQCSIMAPDDMLVAKAERSLAELEHIARDWGSSLDPKRHVKYVARSLMLDSMPSVGYLFKILGPLTVRDPILNPQRHLVFISDWFSRDC